MPGGPPPGLRCWRDEVVQPRGLRAMNPRLRLNRLPPEVADPIEGEPGGAVAGCELARLGAAAAGGAGGGRPPGAGARAADDEAGEREEWGLLEANAGTAVAGGVPAGDALLLDEAELD